MTLAPGETAELRSLFGYLPVGYTAASIVQRYAGDAASSLGRTVRGWEATPQPRLRVPGAEGVWLARELRWHTYMLRAGITRMDLFWNEAMLNQNGNYMYFPRPLSCPPLFQFPRIFVLPGGPACTEARGYEMLTEI